METMARVAPSLHFASPRCSLRSTSFRCPSLASTNPFCATPICLKSQASCLVLAKGRRCTGLKCSASNSSSAGSSERWILEPIGCSFHFCRFHNINLISFQYWARDNNSYHFFVIKNSLKYNFKILIMFNIVWQVNKIWCPFPLLYITIKNDINWTVWTYNSIS